MSTIESILNKMLDNIIYAPVLGYFFTPVKTKVDKFLKSIWPWYVDSYYISAKKYIGRASIVSLFILMVFVLGVSEFFLLSIWDPTIPVVEKAISENPESADKIFLVIIFLINVFLFIVVMRIELINMSIIRFNQMLVIIRPSIEPVKYYQLKSDWALMKSQIFYKKILYDLFSNYSILIDKNKFPDEVKMFEKMKLSENIEISR